MQLGDGERLAVRETAETRPGAQLKVAVRPERIRIEPANGRAPEGGSRIDGTIAELVYLGSLTQFHVDTEAGRIVSHGMSADNAANLGAGRRVTLTWPPEDAAVLAGPPVVAD